MKLIRSGVGYTRLGIKCRQNEGIKYTTSHKISRKLQI